MTDSGRSARYCSPSSKNINLKIFCVKWILNGYFTFQQFWCLGAKEKWLMTPVWARLVHTALSTVSGWVFPLQPSSGQWRPLYDLGYHRPQPRRQGGHMWGPGLGRGYHKKWNMEHVMLDTGSRDKEMPSSQTGPGLITPGLTRHN